MNPLKNVYLIMATGIVVVLQLLAVYTPFLQKILHTVPLSVTDWAYIIIASLSLLALEEIRKLVVRARRTG